MNSNNDDRHLRLPTSASCLERHLCLAGRGGNLCTGVEDALDVTMEQQTELDYLIYNDPLGYADLIPNGDPEKYLKPVAGSHGLED